MITYDLIDSRLNVILSRLGKTVTNAALFREELGADCPSDEAILAEDAKYLAEQALIATTRSAYETLLSQGYDTGRGYKISISQNSFNKLNSYISWLKDMVAANQYTNDTILYLEDMDGVAHPEKVGFIISIKLPYGGKCLQAESIKPKQE